MRRSSISSSLLVCAALWATAARAQAPEAPAEAEPAGEPEAGAQRPDAPTAEARGAPPEPGPAPEAAAIEAVPPDDEPARPITGPAPGEAATGAGPAAGPRPTDPATEPADAAPAGLAGGGDDAAVSRPTDTLDPSRAVLPWFARLTWDHTYNTAGLTRGGEQTFNPTYAWYFVGEAGYLVASSTTLYLRQDLAVELTDSERTATRQDLVLADTIVEAWHIFLRREQDASRLILAGRAGLSLPTSKASRAASMIVSSRARAEVRYGLSNVLAGLDTGISLRHFHRFASSNVVHAESAFPCRVGQGEVSRSCTQLGGPSTVRDAFVLTFDALLAVTPSLLTGAFVWLEWDIAHGLRDASFEPLSGGRRTLADASTTHLRATRILDLWFGYRFTDWLFGRAHVTNSFAERGPDAQLRAPFQPLDTVFGLELTVSFEQLLRGQAGHGGG